MKIALALLALVATASARVEIPKLYEKSLKEEFQDFIDLLPLDDMLAIFVKYATEDEECQRLLEFLQGKEFKDLVTQIEAEKDFANFIDYIQNAGVDAYAIVNAINDLIGLPPYKPSKVNVYGTNGLRGLLDELEAIIPVDKLKALYEKKMKESKVFREFMEQMQSEEFGRLVEKFYNHPTVKKMLEAIEKLGVNLEIIRKILQLLGIWIPHV